MQLRPADEGAREPVAADVERPSPPIDPLERKPRAHRQPSKRKKRHHGADDAGAHQEVAAHWANQEVAEYWATSAGADDDDDDALAASDDDSCGRCVGYCL